MGVQNIGTSVPPRNADGMPAGAPVNSCAASNSTAPTLYDRLKSTPDYSNFCSVIDKPEYSEIKRVLSEPNCLTVFAPTNDAMKNFPQSAGADQTMQVLSYHVVQEKYTVKDAPVRTFPSTLCSSQTVSIQKPPGSDTAQVQSGGGSTARVAKADDVCSNGVIQQVDQALTPPTTPQETMTTLKCGVYVQRAKTAKLDVYLGGNATNVTYFVPQDAAWGGIGADGWSTSQTTDTCKYHIVQDTSVHYTNTFSGNSTTTLSTVAGTQLKITKNGNDFYVNGAKIVKSDVVTKGGCVHVTDKVLSKDGVYGASADGHKVRAALFALSFLWLL